MIVLGLILAIVGYLLGISLVLYLGVILIIVGAVFWIMGSTGRPVGGRSRWY